MHDCAPPLTPRALQPGTHYLDFWKDSKDDIFDLVPRLNAQWADNRTRFVEMAARAQGFAAKFLTAGPRLQYWQRALEEYTALMPDMPQLVQQLVEQLAAAGKLREGGARPPAPDQKQKPYYGSYSLMDPDGIDESSH